MLRAVLAAALLMIGAAGACAQNRSLLDIITSGITGGRDAGWTGTWGTEGRTPIVTVDGGRVTYIGSNGQEMTVGAASITVASVTFQVGSATVALTRRSNTAADMISTIGANASAPILLCRSDAPSCP